MKYCENYQNVTQRHEVSKWCWKNGADRLAQCRVTTNLQFVNNTISMKCNKVKCNKMRNAYNCWEILKSRLKRIFRMLMKITTFYCNLPFFCKFIFEYYILCSHSIALFISVLRDRILSENIGELRKALHVTIGELFVIGVFQITGCQVVSRAWS